MGIRAEYLSAAFLDRVYEIACGMIDTQIAALDAVLKQDAPPGADRLSRAELKQYMEDMAAADPVRAAALMMNDADVRKAVM